MVDVGNKSVTDRVATAEATVKLGVDIRRELDASGFNSKKGSIIHTAIIAGTQAVKQTWSVIPLCHAIPISGCSFDIAPRGDDGLHVACTVRTQGRTGVEMEALHGASVAALTVYDMCKAMSHAISVENIRLVHKSGGKSDYRAS